MAERVLIPLPDGRWLDLDAEAFTAALEAGARAVSASDPSSPSRVAQKLLTAEEIAELTGVPASWFLSAARVGDIPCVKFTKYVRFNFEEVKAKLNVGVE